MSAIFSERQYYKKLKDVINEALAKVATVYEDSTVCRQDQEVITIITEVSKDVDDLKIDVQTAKNKSDIEGYSATTTALQDLETKIDDLYKKLNEELCTNINTKSMETYTELYDSYINLKLNYASHCTTLNTLFSTYDRYNDTYNDLNKKISTTLQTDPAYAKLRSDRDIAKSNRDNCLEQINEFLSKLNSVNKELQKLLADGLQKYSI